MNRTPAIDSTVRSTTPRVKLSRLPICDQIFIAVSLMLLVVEIILLILTILYFYFKLDEYLFYFAVLLGVCLIGSLGVNSLSIFWYRKTMESPNSVFRSVDLGLHVFVHVFQLSLLWRYVLMLRRIRLDNAKLLICELCLLRFLHSTIVSLFSCFILLYFVFKTWFADVPVLVCVTLAFCFCDFCWSLSTFNRKTRRDKSARLVLCWPGIIAQFCWRCGTVGSRTVSLTLYAKFYSYYVLLVVILHWILMVVGLALVFPPFKSAQGRPRKSFLKRFSYGALLAIMYIVFFFNPSTHNTKRRFAYFYFVMFAENSLLASIWIGSSLSVDARWTKMHMFVAVFVWFAFLFGITWMLLYYRYLHPTILSAKFNVADATKTTTQSSNNNSNNITSSHAAVFACTAQLPFRKQPTKFRPQQNAPLAQSASSSTILAAATTAELRNDRRSRSVPVVDRKNRQRNNVAHVDHAQKTNCNSYPKRYHQNVDRIAVLSSANANNFRRQSNDWSGDSSEELRTVLGGSASKIKPLRPTSVGSIVLRTVDDLGGRERIETVF